MLYMKKRRTFIYFKRGNNTKGRVLPKAAILTQKGKLQTLVGSGIKFPPWRIHELKTSG